MDDEAAYPAIDSCRKIPPYSLKEAAARDEEEERNKKRKMKALINLGIINEKGEVGKGFRLPAITGHLQKQVRVSRLSSPYDSPRRSNDKFQMSPKGIIETEPFLPSNHKKILPRKLVSKSPGTRSSKGSLEITEKDLIQIEKSEDLVRRIKKWEGITIDQEYLKERKIAQRKAQYWKRRIKQDFVPQTQSLRKLNEQAKKQKQKLAEMEAQFVKKFRNTQEDPDLVITLQ